MSYCVSCCSCIFLLYIVRPFKKLVLLLVITLPWLAWTGHPHQLEMSTVQQSCTVLVMDSYLPLQCSPLFVTTKCTNSRATNIGIINKWCHTLQPHISCIPQCSYAVVTTSDSLLTCHAHVKAVGEGFCKAMTLHEQCSFPKSLTYMLQETVLRRHIWVGFPQGF